MLEAWLAFLAGLLAGSFLNVCIYRMPRELSVVKPRSYCPSCRRTIAWHDNIPLVSYALLRGRCRWCGAGIGWRYPLVEFVTGTFFATAVLAHGVTPQALKYCLFTALTTGLIFTDLEERILPDEFTIGGALAGFVFAVLAPFPQGLISLLFPADWRQRWVSLGESVFAAVATGLAMLAVRQAYYLVRRRHGMGDADPLMVAMIGSFLGLQPTLLVVVAGSLLGSVVGLAYVWLARKEAADYELPFGSFLGVAALGAALFLKP